MVFSRARPGWKRAEGLSLLSATGPWRCLWGLCQERGAHPGSALLLSESHSGSLYPLCVLLECSAPAQLVLENGGATLIEGAALGVSPAPWLTSWVWRAGWEPWWSSYLPNEVLLFVGGLGSGPRTELCFAPPLLCKWISSRNSVRSGTFSDCGLQIHFRQWPLLSQLISYSLPDHSSPQRGGQLV